MPNWCRGNLVVRGTKDNVKRFLLENLKEDDLEILEDDKKLTIRSKELIFIDGTTRNFIADDIEFNFASEENIKECTMNEFMAAWSIAPEPYTQMSREYEVDIEVCGAEMFRGFTQEIKIQKGEIIIDKVEEINLNFRGGDGEAPNSSNEDLSSEDWKPYSLIEDLDDLPF